MSVQSREARVFGALVASMTACAMLLMLLGNNPPSAGAFCLNSYYELGTIEEAICSQAPQYRGRWNRIEVFYSGTSSGNIEQLYSPGAAAGAGDVNCHFYICNGFGGDDGQIQSTPKWQKQWSVTPRQNSCAADRTIRICVIAVGRNCPPTELQLRRLQELLEELSRKFDIRPQYISYPRDW